MKFRQSSQKMRTDLAKTLDSELELHDPAVNELLPPLDVPVSGGHITSNRHGGVQTIHSKDTHGPGEDAGPIIGALQTRVYELRPPTDVTVSGGHIS